MTRRIQDPVAGGGSRADKPLLALGGIYQTDREREAAAAPALLAALEAWLTAENTDWSDDHLGYLHALDVARGQARAAIAAAKGEV